MFGSVFITVPFRIENAPRIHCCLNYAAWYTDVRPGFAKTEYKSSLVLNWSEPVLFWMYHGLKPGDDRILFRLQLSIQGRRSKCFGGWRTRGTKWSETKMWNVDTINVLKWDFQFNGWNNDQRSTLSLIYKNIIFKLVCICCVQFSNITLYLPALYSLSSFWCCSDSNFPTVE